MSGASATLSARSGGREPVGLLTIIICCSAIVSIAMGVRHGMGLWLQPITLDRGWPRESFAMAIAIQNLCWGIMGPLAGMVADRMGSLRVMLIGGVLYAVGLALMAVSSTVPAFALSAGLLIGVAQAGTTYSVMFGVIGRNVDPSRRAWAMGVVAAAGSFGQFLMVPLENGLIGGLGWQQALFVLAAMSLLVVPCALVLREPRPLTLPGSQSISQAIREAFGTRSFLLLSAGYFVCGFQLAFIGVHLPSYLRDQGLTPQVATMALALIGLFNVFGSYLAGWLTGHVPRRYVLSSIYALRALCIAVFLLLPITPISVYVFSACMGMLWLSTVPPTNAVIAHIFGVRYLSMLSGFAFFSHQLGSFSGVWLGGWLYDATGSYATVWSIAIGLGIFAALVNLPIREVAIARGPAMPAPAR